MSYDNLRTIEIDRQKCCGSGMCAAAAPGYFSLDDSGHVLVLRSSVCELDVAVVEEAVSYCPTEAISVSWQ
jgi:ferredoxin